MVPTATPWRERAQTDSLIEGLVRSGATDGEAIDVLAADRERLRAEVARLLLFQPPPSIIVEGAAGAKLAVAVEREAIAKMAQNFMGDGTMLAAAIRARK